jgi:hypothetical protein
MKQLLKLAFLVFLAAGTSFGQGANCTLNGICTGTITAPSQSVSRPLASTAGAVYVVLSGSSTGTLDFMQSGDGGVSWVAATATDGTTQSTTASSGQWTFPAAGVTNFEVIAESGQSGTANIRINASNANAMRLGGGGSSCSGTSGELLFLNGTACLGVPNSSVDPSTGDVTLGAGFFVTTASNQIGAETGYGEWFETIDAAGISFDATGPDIGSGGGTGPITMTSAGGVSITDNSAAGMTFEEDGAGAVLLKGTFQVPTGASLAPTGTGTITANHYTACINPQSGTSYSLQSTDNGCIVTFSNGSSVTVTVPTGLGAGFTTTLEQLGAGIVSPSASGTTFTTSYVTSGVGTTVALTAVSTDTFTMSFTTGTSGSGNICLQTSCAMTTPSLGAATATSLLASSTVDGRVPLATSTAQSNTIGGTYNTGLTLNQQSTAANTTYNFLPVAANGKVYCAGNSYNGSNPNTGIQEFIGYGAGQYIIHSDGTLGASIQSSGAAGDYGCVYGVDTTHWYEANTRGTWTKTAAPTWTLKNNKVYSGGTANPAQTTAFTNALTAGSLLIVGVIQNTGTTCTPTLSGDTFVDSGAGRVLTGAGGLQVFIAYNTQTTASAQISCANASGVYTQVSASEWTANVPINAYDVSSIATELTSTSGSNNQTTPAITPNQNGELIYSFTSVGGGSLTAGTSTVTCTLLNSLGFGADEYYVQPTAAPVTIKFTNGNGSGVSYSSITVAFKVL